ncbi:MAG TPA: dethiobiotin synthase [Spirochaetota bacterium]|nr:dethiobiotin synthase [Spirochaetota bacterium]
MNKSIFITATSTNIGKTVVSAIICNILSKKVSVCYYKPVQTGCLSRGNELIAPDIEFVKSVNKDIFATSSYLFKNASSPHLASKLEERKIYFDIIKKDYEMLKRDYSYIVVEGAGGLFVPLNENNLFIYNIPKRLKIPVILVSKAGLGAINQVCLSYKFLERLRIKIGAIILLFKNKEPDYIEKDNFDILKKILKFKNIFLLPEVKDCDTENSSLGNIFEIIDRYPPFETIEGWFSK